MAFEPPPMQATAASGSRPSGFLELRFGFLADHGLEIAHHHRIGVRAGDGCR